MPGKWSEVTRMASQGAGRQADIGSQERMTRQLTQKKSRQEYIERVKHEAGIVGRGLKWKQMAEYARDTPPFQLTTPSHTL